MMNEELRELVTQRVSTSRLRQVALKKGMKTLREDGWRRVRGGITTPEEISRVTQEDAS